MTERFFDCFTRPDFHIATGEILQLYLPGTEPVMLSEEECRTWFHQPGEGEVLFEGCVWQEGDRIDCVAHMHCMRNGQVTSLRRKRTVELLPWENKTGAERRGIRLLVNELLKEYFQVQASPWGILRGIRPTKLVHRMLDEGQPTSAIRELLRTAYNVEGDKTALVTDVAVRQRPFLLSPAEARRLVSIYVGIPFCPSRCSYCSFPSFPISGAGRKVGKFLDALRREIWAVQKFLAQCGLNVQTIYIGGGTPTSLPDGEFKQLLNEINQAFQGIALREFTVEAGRPDTLTPDKLSIMREQGVDRISINPQTMREHTLEGIGRLHRPDDVERVFWLARQIGFTNINMDLIAGLPGETPEDMKITLARIGQLRPENVTVHTLAVKRGSNLKDRTGFCLPQAHIVRDMLELCAAAAQSWGLIPYYLYRQKYMAGNLENVGYALPGKECLYNMQIMEERQTILGLGAAAGTKAVEPSDWTVKSCYNPKDVPSYLQELDSYVERKLSLVNGVFENKGESLC